MNDICMQAWARGRWPGSLALAAGLAAVGLVSGCNAAAGATRTQAAVLPRTPVPISCKSPAAWLKLSSLIVTVSSPSAHVVSTCYTGGGARTIAVPQVERATVAAGHTACLHLYQNGRMLHICIAGGNSRSLELPTVTRIELTTKTNSPQP